MFLGNKICYCAHLLTQQPSEHFPIAPQGGGLSLSAECRVMDVLNLSGSFGVLALGDRPLVQGKTVVGLKPRGQWCPSSGK